MLLFMFKYNSTKTKVFRISQCLGYEIQILTCKLDFDFSFPHRHWIPYSYIDHTWHVIHTTLTQELFFWGVIWAGGERREIVGCAFERHVGKWRNSSQIWPVETWDRNSSGKLGRQVTLLYTILMAKSVTELSSTSPAWLTPGPWAA